MPTSFRQLREKQTGRVVVARLEMADNLWKQTVGLMGRPDLPSDMGLWIQPCNGIHTFGMRFPIDVLFLDREGVVLRMVSALKPYRICGLTPKAHTVVELPAGALQRHKVCVGDCLYTSM